MVFGVKDWIFNHSHQAAVTGLYVKDTCTAGDT